METIGVHLHTKLMGLKYFPTENHERLSLSGVVNAEHDFLTSYKK